MIKNRDVFYLFIMVLNGILYPVLFYSFLLNDYFLGNQDKKTILNMNYYGEYYIELIFFPIWIFFMAYIGFRELKKTIEEVR